MSDKKKEFGKIPKESKGKGSKIVKNNMVDLRNVERITNKQKVKWRCKCQHIDENGRSTVFRSDNKRSEITGNPLFVCRICGAYLDLGEITEEKLAEAMDTISRASDIIKFRLRPEQSDEDMENYKMIWKTQYMMKNGKFADLFKAALRRNKNKKRSGGDGGFTIGAPRNH